MRAHDCFLRLTLTLAVSGCGLEREPVALGVASYPARAPAAVCVTGPRTGAAGASDTEATPAGVRYSVRTPANYDSTYAHPLLVVYAPAGKNRYASERYAGLTYEATRNGFVIAYADARPLSRTGVKLLGEIPAHIAARWCIDTQRVYFTGHSDGGSYSMGITVLESSVRPAAIAASGAGIRGTDLNNYRCPARLPVMVLHSAEDERFPGWGREAARWWAKCNGCSAQLSAPDGEGCADYAGCPAAARTRYCEGRGSHRRWPGLNHRVIEFFLAARHR